METRKIIAPVNPVNIWECDKDVIFPNSVKITYMDKEFYIHKKIIELDAIRILNIQTEITTH